MLSNQLLILGNGFDLHCGLQSSYKSFFESTILDAHAEHFDLKQLKAGVSGFWENLLLEYYKKNNKDDYGWCDIEAIIKDTLFTIFTRKSHGGVEIWRNANKNANSNLKPNDIIANIESKPIVLFLFKYCVEFYKASVFQSIGEAKRCLLIHLLQQLNLLERRFCKYLKNQIVNPKNIKELNTGYIVNAVNLLAKLTGFSSTTFTDMNSIILQEYKEIEEKISPTSSVVRWGYVNVLSKEFHKLKTTNILSFNYTALFDILTVENPCVYNNVHGKLCTGQCLKECASSSVIFGIDDALIQAQDSTSKLRLFSKTYRKMLNIGLPINILPPNNNLPIEIKFYGHSLSEADYSYFKSIFDYYDLYGNCKVSLIFCYSKGYEQHEAIYKLISSYGKSLTNKEQGKNLIHKLLLENRLKIEEI